MNFERYDYKANKSFLDYEFYSEGPKGVIKKIVRFTLVTVPSFSYYNLGFGDWNEEQGKIDDFVISNNLDAERVLATVAATVMDFTANYPDATVYAEGSCPARTRRYQMGINKYWTEVNIFFDVYGLVENQGFIPFKQGCNYKAFVVKRKMQ
ncbi:MAG: hypothetical protein J7621_23080 [Niastella sp.]|nr:hypothetical protein [Niastella sp.]